MFSGPDAFGRGVGTAMRGYVRHVPSLLALWLLAGAALAQDDPPGRVGRVTALQGEVWIQEPERGEWIAALPNRPFTGGERLATGPSGAAELRIGSTTVFLGGQTEFEALRLDDERLQFRLQRGQMALRVPSPEVAAELEVQHPEARFRPLRPGFYRIDRLAAASDVTVWRGELQVEAHNLSLALHAGQRAAFWREGTLGDTTRQWLTPQQDEFALAVQRQDQALAQLAPSDLVPAEMTGIEDLQRYGSWNAHPEFGAVWVPSAVVAGWAPYRQGQWVWQRPWGWTWVDAAPWGFAPFHYGRWLWWGNRWCWTPGPRVARPVFAPALVGWVGAPPAPGGARGGRPPPANGWVPLGPREVYRPDYRASPRHAQRLNPYPPVQTPAFANRGVPGAATTWQAPRPQGGFAAQQADEMARRRQWQEQDWRQDAPGRSGREEVAPRAAVPQPAGPAAPSPTRPQPAPAPVQAAAPAAPAAATGPFGGARRVGPEAGRRNDNADRPDPDARRRTPESRGNPRER